MNHGHSNKMMLLMIAALTAIVLAKILSISILFLLVLLCPVMMMTMMFGKNHDHKR